MKRTDGVTNGDKFQEKQMKEERGGTTKECCRNKMKRIRGDKRR